MRWLVLVLVSILMFATTNGQSVRMEDTSDWWSMYNEKEPGLPVEMVDKNFDVKNFKILGLSLDTVSFDQVRATLGKARMVDRGDASYGRSQVCYVSGRGDAEPIHLIFEGGEGQSFSFYLFRGGPNWNGSNLCVKSDRVSADLATGTGLRLGLSRDQVEAILGKPDSEAGNRIAYCREFYRKASKEEFERSRRENPEVLNDKLAHEKFDLVLVTLQLEARFRNLRTDYLYVSTESLNDN